MLLVDGQDGGNRMMLWIVLGIAIIEMIAIIYLIRFVTKQIIGNFVDGNTYEPEVMTGKDIENIRLNALSGASIIGNDYILDLIFTLRHSILGTYEDLDGYIPPDPYENVSKEKIGVD